MWVISQQYYFYKALNWITQLVGGLIEHLYAKQWTKNIHISRIQFLNFYGSYSLRLHIIKMKFYYFYYVASWRECHLERFKRKKLYWQNDDTGEMWNRVWRRKQGCVKAPKQVDKTYSWNISSINLIYLLPKVEWLGV